MVDVVAVSNHCDPHISSINIQVVRRSWEEAITLDDVILVEKI